MALRTFYRLSQPRDTDLRRVTLAVFGAAHPREQLPRLLGSAFSIGGGFFLTAGHVGRDGQDYAVQLLGYVPTGSPTSPTDQYVATVESLEPLAGIDLAVLYCPNAEAVSLPWYVEAPGLLAPVACCGFPLAEERERRVIYFRANSGVISAGRQLHEVEGTPFGYELSFATPKGFSGAPLLLSLRWKAVVGLIVMNGRSGMRVGFQRDISSDGSKEMIHEQYELLTFGMAISSAAILSGHSDLLRGVIGDHLVRQRLLPMKRWRMLTEPRA